MTEFKTTISDETPYGIVDCQTGEVVLRSTYKNRSAVRRAVDKRDNAYGAVRFSPQILKDEPKAIPMANMRDLDKVMGW